MASNQPEPVKSFPKPLPGAINPNFNKVIPPEVTKYVVAKTNPVMIKRIRRFTT